MQPEMPGPTGQRPGQEHQQAGDQHTAQGQEEETPGAGLDGQYQAHPGSQQRSEQDRQQQHGRRIHQVGGAQHGSAQQGKHEEIEGGKSAPGQAVQAGGPLICGRHDQLAMLAPAAGACLASRPVKRSEILGQDGFRVDNFPGRSFFRRGRHARVGLFIRRGRLTRGGLSSRRGRLD